MHVGSHRRPSHSLPAQRDLVEGGDRDCFEADVDLYSTLQIVCDDRRAMFCQGNVAMRIASYDYGVAISNLLCEGIERGLRRDVESFVRCAEQDN